MPAPTFMKSFTFFPVLLFSVSIFVVPTHANENLDREKAISYFDQAFANKCLTHAEAKFLFEDDDKENPARYEIDAGQTKSVSDTQQTTDSIFAFYCTSGAYNHRYVYLKYDGDSFSRLNFASPILDVQYKTGTDDREINNVSITGYVAHSSLTNPVFDANKRTLTESRYWRGLGDAYEKSTYVYIDSQFVLKTYEADVTYDDKVKPQIQVDF